MRGQMTAYINSSTVEMTQPKANGNVSSFDYVIKEMVNVAAVEPLSYDARGRLLSTQKASVPLGCRLVQLLRFFRA